MLPAGKKLRQGAFGLETSEGAVAEAVRRHAVRVAASWVRRTALRTLPSSERAAGSTAKRQRTATSVLGDRLGCFWFASGKALNEY